MIRGATLFSCWILAGSILLAAGEVSAQGNYPNKPVKVINPYQAGGGADLWFRMLVPAIEEQLGEKIIIENKTGAGGNIGTQFVSSAAPDGYTLLIAATNNLVVNQYVFPNMPFDPLKTLVPITMTVEVPSVFYVHPEVPATSIQEFLSWVKANPGKVNFASPGVGTTPHLNVELLAQLTGINLTHIPFRGLPDAMKATLANETQLYIAGLAAGIAHLKAGRLRAIAVGSRERLPALPDVPTVAESGLRNYEAANWFALAAPAGTNAEIINRWANAVRVALAQPSIRTRLTELGLLPGGMSPKEFGSQVHREAKLWEQTVRAANIRAE